MFSGGLAGLLSGLLGVGGGFVIVPALKRYTDLPTKSIAATSLGVLAIVASGGTLFSVISGKFDLAIATPFATGIGSIGNGAGNGNASRPQIFSATFLKMMPSAMVDIIHPNLDLILIAGRTLINSTKLPCNMPNKHTMGIVTQ